MGAIRLKSQSHLSVVAFLHLQLLATWFSIPSLDQEPLALLVQPLGGASSVSSKTLPFASFPRSELKRLSNENSSNALRMKAGGLRTRPTPLLGFLCWNAEADASVEWHGLNQDIEALGVGVLPCAADACPDGVAGLRVANVVGDVAWCFRGGSWVVQ